MNNVLSKHEKISHDNRVHIHHKHALNIVRGAIDDAQGFRKRLLEKSEVYHLTRLTNQRS